MMTKEESEKFIEHMFKRGSWLGLPTSVYIGNQKVITDIDVLELHNAIHNYKEQAKRDHKENELLSQELGREKLLNKSLEEEVNMLQTTESNELNETKQELRKVEAVWQTRIQEVETSAKNRISSLERDKALLYRELKLMSELLEDREKSATNRTSASEDEVVRLRKVLEDVKAQLSYAVAQRDYAEKEMKKDKEPLYNEFERVATMLHSEEEANDRLEEEVDRLKGVLEDKVGLLSWHIVQRGLHSRKYESLMETNKLLQEQIEVLQEAIYGRDKKWGIQ